MICSVPDSPDRQKYSFSSVTAGSARATSRALRDEHAAGDVPTAVRDHRDLRVLHLAVAARAAQLLDGFVHVAEAVEQLRGSCGDRQVQDAEVAVVSNGGGHISGC